MNKRVVGDPPARPQQSGPASRDYMPNVACRQVLLRKTGNILLSEAVTFCDHLPQRFYEDVAPFFEPRTVCFRSVRRRRPTSPETPGPTRQPIRLLRVSVAYFSSSLPFRALTSRSYSRRRRLHTSITIPGVRGVFFPKTSMMIMASGSVRYMMRNVPAASLMRSSWHRRPNGRHRTRVRKRQRFTALQTP